MSDPGNIFFLTDGQRAGVLWAIDLALRWDDGFSWPRDQNREILKAARETLTGSAQVDPWQTGTGRS